MYNRNLDTLTFIYIHKRTSATRQSLIRICKYIQAYVNKIHILLQIYALNVSISSKGDGDTSASYLHILV